MIFQMTTSNWCDVSTWEDINTLKWNLVQQAVTYLFNTWTLAWTL